MLYLGPLPFQDIDKLESTQRRASRFVSNNFNKRASVLAMSSDLGWDCLQSRRKDSRIRLMNKMIVGRVAITLEDHVTEASTRIRSVNSHTFQRIATRTLVFKNSFFPCSIPDWNRTLDSVVHEEYSEFENTAKRD